MDNYGILSLLPPVIAIFLAIRTKQVFISLITGIFIGWLIIGEWNPLKGFLLTIDGIVNVFSDIGNTRVVLFTFLVGSIITFIQISGGVAGFINDAKKYISTNENEIQKSRKKAQIFAALTGIMMMVVIGTFAWTSFKILGKIPKEDAFIIILVTGVTVVQDLAIAVIVGVIVSALVYSWKSSKVIRISLENQSSEDEKTYKLHGSVFFGSVNNLKTLIKPSNDKEKIVTLDCSDAWLWDQSAIEAIKTLTEKYNKAGKILKIKNLGPYSLRVVTKANKVFNINLVK